MNDGVELERIADRIGGELIGRSATVNHVTSDSRRARPNSLFVCIPGARTDGHRFAVDAVAAGATGLLVERRLDLPVGQILVDDARSAAGPAAAEVLGHPERDLTMIGITGTNGKTTVAALIASCLRRLGTSPAVIGTLGGTLTTPEASDLFEMLDRYRSEGSTHVAMEVSSHALELGRVAGIVFDVAVFTNLSQDHLDFHGTMEDYFEAKAKLFDRSRSRRAVVCVDDAAGRTLAERRPDAVRYSITDADGLVLRRGDSSFRWRDHQITFPFAGRHNALNAIGAATVMSVLGYDESSVAAAIGESEPVPGRMEWVRAGQCFGIVVDYSHTPHSLEVALDAAREAAEEGAVLLVFGCGGDRDRDKRPKMGSVAVAGADRVFVTSDNPRSEDPQRIIDDVLAGLDPRQRGVVTVIPDRRTAIEAAVRAAGPRDVVLISGKGHENYQIIGSQRIDFDDRAVAAAAVGGKATGP